MAHTRVCDIHFAQWYDFYAAFTESCNATTWLKPTSRYMIIFEERFEARSASCRWHAVPQDEYTYMPWHLDKRQLVI